MPVIALDMPRSKRIKYERVSDSIKVDGETVPFTQYPSGQVFYTWHGVTTTKPVNLTKDKHDAHELACV